MPLVQISIYLSWSRTLHSIWRESRLQPSSPSWTLAVLKKPGYDEPKTLLVANKLWEPSPREPQQCRKEALHSWEAQKLISAQVTFWERREKRASGSFREMRVLRDFAEGLLLNKQFTAHVNTWCFLSSKLKEVSIPQVGGERCYSSTTSPQLFF